MIIKVLQRLRILDNDGTLCLSHIAFAVSIVAIAAHPEWETALLFTLSILNFNAKKWFAVLWDRKRIADQDLIARMRGEIDRLEKEFQKLNAAMTFKNIGR